ncbi:MAG: hypothetical protein HY717_02910 [Planctomycetes bacterium]|nr:hypothetical protein [Planctomycetota bacterium]
MRNALFASLAISAVLGTSFAAPADLIDSKTVKGLFHDPPAEYSTGPLWVWNDLLTEEQIVDTLRDLAGQNVKQAFVHPRPGLMTPYLSSDWFRLWKVALGEAEKLGMHIWIYDENSYPSGFAGGFVPEAMPESRGRGLALREEKATPAPSNDLLAIFKIDGERHENVTARVRAGEKLPEGRYLAALQLHAGASPWYGGKSYVDLLRPGVTEKFLEITLGAYRREIGEHFGKLVPGIFTDEPQIQPAGGLPWTESLPEEFQKRWGYSLLDHLPCLSLPVGDFRKVRHNYFQLLNDLFIERWARPYFEAGEKNRLEMTGHYWEHDWPVGHRVPDNMAMYAWQQRPGIDTLMNQYSEDVHAQFGNARAVKELSSVANQLGKKRTLCEVYGAGGWDLRFEDMKRIGDWLGVLGVNTFDQHLSYITIRGARKRDHPQSFSYHEPWWKAYHVSATYLARLSAALSQGEQVNPVLVLEPTTAAWMYLTASGGQEARLNEIGASFQRLVLALEMAQVEYDLGCEDILARHGAVRGGDLAVGQRSYRLAVLPPHTENLNRKTLSFLEEFLEGGGAVLSCGPPAERVDGSPSERPAALSRSPGWKRIEAERLPEELLTRTRQGGFAIHRAAGDQGILFHCRRRIADGEILFLANTSIEHGSAGTLDSSARGVEEWSLETGAVSAYPVEKREGGVRAAFSLPPSGSLLLFLSQEERPAGPAREKKFTAIPPAGPSAIRRLEPNVLVLDYVDIAAAGEIRKDLYFYRASQFAFQKNGQGIGIDRNPWDSAVQFKDELLRKKFPEPSGFEATYRFTIAEKVPEDLAAVVERPDLYQMTLNGSPVAAAKGAWWLDKAFGKIGIAQLAKVGENALTLKASPFTIFHELEPVYILGDFDLKAAERGFVIVPAKGLRPGRWSEQGQPFYAAGVAYTEKFNLEAVDGLCLVSLPAWHGSVAEVMVNSKPAGTIASPPWERDVTGLVRSGENTIVVIVYGTLKNTLGPHHAGSIRGAAWPGMFQKGPETGPPPGGKYDVIGYGLFEPFQLKCAAAPQTASPDGPGRELPTVILRDAPRLQFPAPTDCNSPTHWDGDTFYLFNSAGHPQRSSGSDLFHLGPAAPSKYDNQVNGGRWIECTWKDDDGSLYGWYHHEPAGLCPGTSLTAPKIGAVVSSDNGARFQDLGIVLEARAGTLNCAAKNGYFAGGHGDFSVMLAARKEYFYFFFGSYAGDVSEQGVAVARMRYADRKSPAGKVWKWHQGGWGEPGVGGRLTPFFPAAVDWAREDADAFWGPSIHWNTHLNRYVILLNRTKDKPGWPQEGIYVTFNGDLDRPENWTKPVKIYNGGRWYPQVIGLNKSKRETDKLAGQTARFFMRGENNYGESRWEIVFLKPGEKN